MKTRRWKPKHLTLLICVQRLYRATEKKRTGSLKQSTILNHSSIDAVNLGLRRILHADLVSYRHKYAELRRKYAYETICETDCDTARASGSTGLEKEDIVQMGEVLRWRKVLSASCLKWVATYPKPNVRSSTITLADPPASLDALLLWALAFSASHPVCLY